MGASVWHRARFLRNLLTKQAGSNDTPIDLSTYVDDVHRTLTMMETSSIAVDDSYTPPAPRGVGDPEPHEVEHAATQEFDRAAL